MAKKHAAPAIPPPWRPRKDAPTYVISAVVFVLELPVLAVLALAALLTGTATRTASAMAKLRRIGRRGKIAT